MEPKILFIYLFLFIAPQFTVGQNWETTGGTPERNGRGGSYGPESMATPAWSVTNAANSLWGNAIFSFNDRFVTSRVSFSPVYHVTVECRKLSDGGLLWEKSSGSDGKLYVVGMTEEAVYVHNYSTDSLYAFSPLDGAEKWVCPEQARIFGGAHGILFACNGDPVVNGPGTYTKSLMRLDKNTGQVLWFNTNLVSVSPAPDFCIYGDRLYKWEGAINAPTHLVAIDLNTGENLFFSEAIGGDPDQEIPLTAGPDGTIYGQRDGGDLWAITDNGSSFTVKWSHPTKNGGMGTYGNIGVGNDGSLYFADGKIVKRLDPATGDVLNLSESLSTTNMSGTYIAIDPDGVVFISNSGASDGKYFAFSADLQTKLWEYAVPMNYYAGPQLNQNGIFVTAGSGTGLKGFATSTSHPPASDFTADVRSITGGQFVRFTDISGFEPTTWEWSFPGGIPSQSSLQQPPPVQYNIAGEYPVELITSNGFGLDTLLKKCYVYVSTSVGGPDDVNRKSLCIFPNPSGGNFTIDFGKEFVPGDMVYIHDIRGVMVYHKIIEQPRTYFQLNLHDGIYFVTITGPRRCTTGKLMVNKTF